MANIVCLGSDINSQCIQMSNGLTDVFINVLILSGSRLAQTADEKRLIVWLAEKDQSKVGMGTVGFDICDMPWNKDNFEENKGFLLNVIEAANNKEDWNALNYEPNTDLLFPCLDKFKELISKIETYDINFEAQKEWLAAADAFDPVVTAFPKCPQHGVLLSCFGCQICNNQY